MSSASVRQIRLIVPMSDVEVAGDRLWQAGARAVEELTADSGGDTVELRTVLSQDDAVSRRLLGALAPTWKLLIVDVDVHPAHTWREFARPIEVGDSLVVAPAWDASPDSAARSTAVFPSGRLTVEIEPGSAFGLGDHPTTQLMLQVIEALPLTGAEVLDVGCGTGVLGIVAAKRGAARVVGIDVAAAACEATLDNADRNGVTIEVSTTPIADVAGAFTVVLANILAPTLISMSADLARLTARSGTLVVSGVLDGGADHVLAALDEFGVVGTATMDGWAAYVLRRPTDR